MGEILALKNLTSVESINNYVNKSKIIDCYNARLYHVINEWVVNYCTVG